MSKNVSIASLGQNLPEILTPKELADYLKISVKTIYLWLREGLFEGCSRKRGRHIRIWRDCALEKYFNGPKKKPRPKL